MTPHDHPSKALTATLIHDATVLMEDRDFGPQEAASTVVTESDFVPEDMEAHYSFEVKEALEEREGAQ